VTPPEIILLNISNVYQDTFVLVISVYLINLYLQIFYTSPLVVVIQNSFI
jgi:hypothetical protein